MSKIKDQLKGYWGRKIWDLHRKNFSPLSISNWYGRLGNNIQQICVGIIYARKQNLRFQSPDHTLIRPVSFGLELPRWHPLIPKNRFFFYSATDGNEQDVPLDYELLCDEIQQVAREYVTPKLKIPVVAPFESDTLVIHLRGGDILSDKAKGNLNYVQNPLSFYRKLVPQFRKTIVVAEPGGENPVQHALESIGSVTIQSSSVEKDFATLMAAKNIATSGVGTFAVAAALCSTNLKNFYFSDRYMTEHLNPEMLRGLVAHRIALPGYLEVGTWSNSIEIKERMLHYQLTTEFKSFRV